jgi:signal transduction histidine kinase
MTRMVSNLLDISRLEQNQLPLKPEKTDPGEMLCDMRTDFQSMAEQRKTILPRKPLGTKIKMDADMIRRVIENLFINAVKHTDKGGRIEIRVRKKPEQNIVISVIDDGEGIAEDQKEVVFEKFSQARHRQRGRKTDTGLGLTFCKLAVEAHGGAIKLRSELGKGTTFDIILPPKPPADNA